MNNCLKISVKHKMKNNIYLNKVEVILKPLRPFWPALFQKVIVMIGETQRHVNNK